MCKIRVPYENSPWKPLCLSYKACLVYLNDIIITRCSFEEHLNNIRCVLRKLKKANLELSPFKCHLFRREITYLGHITSAEDANHESTRAVLSQEIDGQKRVIVYFSPLPSSSDGNNILVVMDYFTKWPEAYPISDQEAPDCCRGSSSTLDLKIQSSSTTVL
ncbi:retrovirus-related Pol polyprotein from transposon 412 [Trichonephila clavipes]|nr:retrovirus-related Pol polyprotein from transposon 412 [Trichonephila clavipes]